MFPYILVYLIFALSFFKNDKNSTNILFGVLIVVLAVFIGSRDMIGGFDVYIYGAIYESSNEAIFKYPPFEYGFKLYYLFLKLFSSNRHFMFFMTALICVAANFIMIKKYSKALYITLYIYFAKFCLMHFVYLRQILAMSVIWFAIPYIVKRKPIWFFGFIFLAANLHLSALIFVPMYFLYNIKLTNVKIFLLLMGALLIAYSPIGAFIFSFFADSTGNEKIGVYVQKTQNVVNVFYLLEIFLILLLIRNFKEKFYGTIKGTVIVNGMVFYLGISAMALNNATFVRFSWYPYYFVIIGLSYIYSFIDDKENKKHFLTLIFLYFGLMFIRLVIVIDGGDWIPYKAFFFDFPFREGQFDWMEYR
jgi:hypothetical protein